MVIMLVYCGFGFARNLDTPILILSCFSSTKFERPDERLHSSLDSVNARKKPSRCLERVSGRSLTAKCNRLPVAAEKEAANRGKSELSNLANLRRAGVGACGCNKRSG
jgi:hypothetical protein